MGIELVPPTERVCERCGRHDEWDSETENWVIVGETGSPTCIHEWDINGTHDPIAGTA
ncbi:HEWD family protein [Halosegnis longus]|uniref:HEWD family protein n=1 Tax=Halosegnis longus TaxID=2216012 RepID=UPI001561B734|nr:MULTISPECIES: HEWD family protein [Halobacteriales]